VAELASHPWFKRSLSVDSQLDGLLGGQAERELAFQAAAARRSLADGSLLLQRWRCVCRC